MFNKNINNILLENKSHNIEDLLIQSKNNTPKEIDDFYQQKVQDMSNKMIERHKNFIKKEKDIFSMAWNDIKYSKGSIDFQYELLTTKYNIYGKDIINQVNTDLDQVIVYMLAHTKDIKIQRNLIQKFIDEKRIDIQKARFTAEPIAFSTCLFPSSEAVITIFFKSKKKTINLWFTDEKRLVDRMINELELYSSAEILTSEEIIKLYDKYIIDLQKYFKQYKKHNEILKINLEKYIETKQEEYGKDLKITQNEAKQIVLNKLHILMDKYFHILKMITFHYNIQLKFILESFKSISRTMQKAYDFLMLNR